MTTTTAANQVRRTVPAGREGEIRVYMSSRSVAGYPYLAEALVEAVRRRSDGRLVWFPLGPRNRPTGHVPCDWYRDGTAKAAAKAAAHADAPPPVGVRRMTRLLHAIFTGGVRSW